MAARILRLLQFWRSPGFTALGETRRKVTRSPPFLVFMTAFKVIALYHVTSEYGYSWGAGSGPSMLPGFLVRGETFWTSRHYRRGRDVQVGDIVEYWIPHKPGELGIKRVIGMPGDYVLLNDPTVIGTNAMIQVPKGHCYIVGDNLPWSSDSRHFGPIPLGLVRGKVVKRGTDSWWPTAWYRDVESGLTREDEPPE